MAQRARREGSFRERLKLFVLRRVLFNVWRLAERLGIRLATEGPTYAPTDAQREAMDALVARARAEGGVIDASSTGFSAHELLTHLVERHGLDQLIEPRKRQPGRQSTARHHHAASRDRVSPHGFLQDAEAASRPRGI